jgi:hypothetical protein
MTPYQQTNTLAGNSDRRPANVRQCGQKSRRRITMKTKTNLKAGGHDRGCGCGNQGFGIAVAVAVAVAVAIAIP